MDELQVARTIVTRNGVSLSAVIELKDLYNIKTVGVVCGCSLLQNEFRIHNDIGSDLVAFEMFISENGLFCCQAARSPESHSAGTFSLIFHDSPSCFRRWMIDAHAALA